MRWCRNNIATSSLTRATPPRNDLETLGDEVRKRVKDHSGIILEWEIRRIGVELKGGVS
jgi:hypothetical protein